MVRIPRTVIAALVSALVAGGCAQAPMTESSPDSSGTPPQASMRPAPLPSRTVSEAMRQHRRLADGARQSGDLATAQIQLEILQTLAPGDATIGRDLASVRAAIAAEAREQYHTGHSALAAGDLDRAQAAMLRVLAVDPEQADAAKALREIERRRVTRIQADRAAKVRSAEEASVARNATRSMAPPVATAAADANDAFDVDQAIEMLRAGDASGGLRDLKAYVAANPGNRAARQRIGAAVAERARDLEDQGRAEQALALYEQASTLRGDNAGPWVARLPPLRKKISQEYFERGTRAFRTNVGQAIGYLETSLRFDPANTQAAIKLKEAKMAREKLEKIK